jgi:hypothetical protein
VVGAQEQVRLLLQVVCAQDFDDAVAGRQLAHPGRRIGQCGLARLGVSGPNSRRAAFLRPGRSPGRRQACADQAAHRKAGRACRSGQRGAGRHGAQGVP